MTWRARGRSWGYWIGQLPTPRQVTKRDAMAAVKKAVGPGKWRAARAEAMSGQGMMLGPEFGWARLFTRSKQL